MIRAAASLIGLGAATALWATRVEREAYRLHSITLDGLTDRGKTVRVLHITDTHLTPPAPKLEAFLRGLAHVDCDLIAITGDMLGAVDAIDPLIAALDPLLATNTPAVAILGLNDKIGPTWRNPLSYLRGPSSTFDGPDLDTDRYVDELERRGVDVFRDRTAVVNTAAGPIAVGGFDDTHPMTDDTALPSLDSIRPDVDVILSIGLVHAPYSRALDLMAEAGWNLTLCGHTHGGQVCLPGGRALVTNCDLPARHASGVHMHGPMAVHVSQGLGTSKYQPFRFSCPPQAEILTIT